VVYGGVDGEEEEVLWQKLQTDSQTVVFVAGCGRRPSGTET